MFMAYRIYGMQKINRLGSRPGFGDYVLGSGTHNLRRTYVLQRFCYILQCGNARMAACNVTNSNSEQTPPDTHPATLPTAPMTQTKSVSTGSLVNGTETLPCGVGPVQPEGAAAAQRKLEAPGEPQPQDGAEASGRWSDVPLEELRARLAEFSRERNWDQYHTPRNLLLALVGETGELSELFQWRPEAEAGPGLPGFSAQERVSVEEELADVLLYLVRLADRCGIDLGQAALSKMRKNAAKYPADKCHGSSAKYTAYDEQGQGQGQPSG